MTTPTDLPKNASFFPQLDSNKHVHQTQKNSKNDRSVQGICKHKQHSEYIFDSMILCLVSTAGSALAMPKT